MAIHKSLYGSFNNRIWGWIIILVATGSKSLLTGVFTSYETDKSFYLLLANNLAEGKGFTVPVSLLTNPVITENIYLPSAISPFYSILAAPLVKLFPGNYFLVTWLLESCSWLLLFIILYKILRRIMPDYFWPNVFILFSGFFLYNIELASSPKDILSTALLFVGLLQCLRIGEMKKVSWLSLIFSSVLFFLPGFTKAIYSPITLVFPLSILFIGLIGRDRIRIRAGFIMLLISTALFTAHHFYFQGLETRSFTLHREFFMERWGMVKGGDDFIQGYYFNNLRRLYPFIPASFFNLDSTGARLRDHIPSLYLAYGFILSLFNAIGLAALIVVFFSACKRFYRKLIPESIFFLLTGLSISFAIILITCVLSVLYRAVEYKGSTDSWTFVYENRPYFFIMLFLQASIFLFLFSRQMLTKPWSRLRWLLAIIMTIGALHGFYFVIKNAVSPAPKKITVNQLVTLKADSIRKANPGQKLLLATEMPHLDWYAKLKNIHVVNLVSLLNDSAYKAPPETILLTALAREDSVYIRNYLNKPGVSLLENYYDTFLLFIETTARQ